MAATEWRVCYRRDTWHRKNGGTVRIFQTRRALERFIEQLENRGPGLTYTVEIREVGRWREEPTCHH